MSNQTEMERYMRLALEEATLAFDAGGSHHFPETMLATFFAT